MPHTETTQSQRWSRWHARGYTVIGSTLLALAGCVFLMAMAKWLITGGDEGMAACITMQTQAGLAFDAAVAQCR